MFGELVNGKPRPMNPQKIHDVINKHYVVYREGVGAQYRLRGCFLWFWVI